MNANNSAWPDAGPTTNTSSVEASAASMTTTASILAFSVSYGLMRDLRDTTVVVAGTSLAESQGGRSEADDGSAAAAATSAPASRSVVDPLEREAARDAVGATARDAASKLAKLLFILRTVPTAARTGGGNDDGRLRTAVGLSAYMAHAHGWGAEHRGGRAGHPPPTVGTNRRDDDHDNAYTAHITTTSLHRALPLNMLLALSAGIVPAELGGPPSTARRSPAVLATLGLGEERRDGSSAPPGCLVEPWSPEGQTNTTMDAVRVQFAALSQRLRTLQALMVHREELERWGFEIAPECFRRRVAALVQRGPELQNDDDGTETMNNPETASVSRAPLAPPEGDVTLVLRSTSLRGERRNVVGGPEVGAAVVRVRLSLDASNTWQMQDVDVRGLRFAVWPPRGAVSIDMDQKSSARVRRVVEPVLDREALQRVTRDATQRGLEAGLRSLRLAASGVAMHAIAASGRSLAEKNYHEFQAMMITALDSDRHDPSLTLPLNKPLLMSAVVRSTRGHVAATFDDHLNPSMQEELRRAWQPKNRSRAGDTTPVVTSVVDSSTTTPSLHTTAVSDRAVSDAASTTTTKAAANRDTTPPGPHGGDGATAAFDSNGRGAAVVVERAGHMANEVVWLVALPISSSPSSPCHRNSHVVDDENNIEKANKKRPRADDAAAAAAATTTTATSKLDPAASPVIAAGVACDSGTAASAATAPISTHAAAAFAIWSLTFSVVVSNESSADGWVHPPRVDGGGVARIAVVAAQRVTGEAFVAGRDVWRDEAERAAIAPWRRLAASALTFAHLSGDGRDDGSHADNNNNNAIDDGPPTPPPPPPQQQQRSSLPDGSIRSSTRPPSIQWGDIGARVEAYLSRRVAMGVADVARPIILHTSGGSSSLPRRNSRRDDIVVDPTGRRYDPHKKDGDQTGAFVDAQEWVEGMITEGFSS